MLVDTLRYLVFFVSMQYVLLLLVTGHDAVKSPQWDRRFREAGAVELYRRGVFARKNTVEELSALENMVGNEPPHGYREDSGDTYKVIAILSGSTDRARMGADLDRRRSRLLGVALERQFRRVRNVHDIKWVYRLWFVQRLLSSAEVSVRGAIWMVPRSVGVVGNSFGTYSKHISVSAVLFGLFWWGVLARDSEMQSVVASITGTGLIGGVLFAVGHVWWAVLVARFGPPETWERWGVVRGLCLLGVLGAAFAVAMSGIVQKTNSALIAFTERIEPADGGRPTWWHGVLLLAGVGWAVRNCVRNAAHPLLVTRDRLGFVMGAGVFTGVGVAYTGIALNVHARGFMIAGGALIFGSLSGIGAVIAILTARDRFCRYRFLTAAGYTVPRKGFRCWALVTWFVVSGGLVAWLELTTSRPGSTGYLVEQWAALMVIVTLTLTFVPGMIVTLMYMRRIDRDFSRLSFHHSVASDLTGNRSPYVDAASES